MIRTKGLTKRFGETLAVDALDLEVEPGQIFGFLGPNGAGKTTTVRLLCCLIAPTSGEAFIDGLRVGQEDSAIRQVVGILTESPGLYERLSAYQNLEFFARLYGLSPSQSRRQVERYLEILDLWDRRAEPVGAFSKGMKQRLAIARALLHEPKVLFLDEPTSGLDPEGAKTVRDFVAELRAEGRTVFLCTHNLDEADRLCDRIGFINQRLLTVDTPEALRERFYGHRIVVELRASHPEVTAVVRALPFVKSLEEQGSGLVIELGHPQGQTPELVRAVVLAGGEVLSVSREQHTLEDVYLRFVRGEAE